MSDNNAIEAMFREFGPVVVWGNIHAVVGWTPKDGAGIHPLAEVDDDMPPDEVAALINDGARARGWLPPADGEWTARAALEDIAKGMDRRALAAREGKEQAKRDYMDEGVEPLRAMHMRTVERLTAKRSDSEHFARLCRTHPAYGDEP